MSFMDQRARIATEDDLKVSWGGRSPGEGFRCNICGHKFKVGDYWRWVYAAHLHLLNIFVCEKCDGPDVLEKWKKANQELKECKKKFWWAF